MSDTSSEGIDRRGPALPPAERAALGGVLRGLRQGHGLSLQKVAEAAGVSRQALHQIERGHSEPGMGTLAALADELGVTVADVLRAAGL